MRILPYVLLKFKGQPHKFITMKFLFDLLGARVWGSCQRQQKTSVSFFTGSLARDFWLQVFFHQCPPGPWVFHLGRFDFFAEIFANGCLSPVYSHSMGPSHLRLPLPHPSVGSIAHRKGGGGWVGGLQIQSGGGFGTPSLLLPAQLFKLLIWCWKWANFKKPN